MSSTKKFERLPKSVIPSHYDIWLKPNLTKFTFQGTITAHLEVSSIHLRFILIFKDIFNALAGLVLCILG
jgi:puromycin-sensitive aminopeptidase